MILTAILVAAVVDDLVVGDGRLAIPAGARVIGLGGATLLPGLIDLHTHLADVVDGPNRFEIIAFDEGGQRVRTGRGHLRSVRLRHALKNSVLRLARDSGFPPVGAFSDICSDRRIHFCSIGIVVNTYAPR